MKLINWLKDWLSNIFLERKRPNITILQDESPEQPKQPENEEDIIPPTPLGNITFSILNDGTVYINCHWAHESVAPAYGELMYKINNGNFTEDIIDTLLGRLPQSPQDAPAVREIVDCWKTIKDNEENQPLISPSDVFAIEQPEMQMSPNMEDME